MVKHPDTSSSLVTWVWGNYHVGALGASMLVGPLADFVGPRVIFWICIPLAAQIILPSLRGWLPEKKLAREERGINTSIISAQPRLFILAIAMAVAALGMALVNLFSTRLVQSLYAIAAATSLCVLGFICLDRGLAMANLYMFLTNALYISTDGALDFFYTADEDCVPGGPAFSYTFYVTWANVLGSSMAIAGVAIFQRTMSGQFHCKNM